MLSTSPYFLNKLSKCYVLETTGLRTITNFGLACNRKIANENGALIALSLIILPWRCVSSILRGLMHHTAASVHSCWEASTQPPSCHLHHRHRMREAGCLHHHLDIKLGKIGRLTFRRLGQFHLQKISLCVDSGANLRDRKRKHRVKLFIRNICFLAEHEDLLFGRTH